MSPKRLTTPPAGIRSFYQNHPSQPQGVVKSGAYHHWLWSAIQKPVPLLELSPLSGKPRGKLRITPEQLLRAIHAQALAVWSLQAPVPFQAPRLKRVPGGRPATNRDDCILLMAVVQTRVAYAVRCQRPELHRRRSSCLAHL